MAGLCYCLYCVKCVPTKYKFQLVKVYVHYQNMKCIKPEMSLNTLIILSSHVTHKVSMAECDRGILGGLVVSKFII